jgi:purine-binding chemotaxis protein CheW
MAVEGDSLNQWLVLSLERREYALPVKHVVEVLRMVAVTPMPEAPAWIAGVLNLRGKGIVVMDLRTRLALPARTPDLNNQIVIVDSKGELLGLIVDEVVEIITLPGSALKPADKLSGASAMFAALAHAGERLILVLDLDRLVGSPPLAA